MSREQEHNAFRRLRTELHDSQRHHYGLNTRTVSSSSYQDTVQRGIRGDLEVSSHRNVRDAANMPIFLDDTHKSNISSREFNSKYGSNIQPSNIRSHTTPVSAALEALQTYGPVQSSSSHSSMQRDWNVGFPKNINNPSEKLQAFLSKMLNSNDSNIQTHSAESSTMSASDLPCPPFSDLNLNNVDEEDEYLYGDSNSLPEVPQLSKKDSDQSKVKKDRPMWSDEEDLFGESSVTPQNKSNLDQMKNSTVWTVRNKNIQLKLSHKPEGITKDSSKNMPHETYPVEQHSSVSSAVSQNARNLFNKIPEKDLKNIMPEKDSKVTSSSVKSKYHVAAQMLKNKIADKSKIFASETTDFRSNYLVDMKNNSMSFKDNNQENKLTVKSDIPTKDPKELKPKKSGDNVKRLPKAFLQKDLDTIANYIKPERKRMHSREEDEVVKHPRHENYRNVSPSREQSSYQSSRHRSPVDERRHHSPHHSRYRSPESDLRYKMAHYFKSKSPHRDYDRHPYEYHARHYEGGRHHSRSPSRRSSEHSSRHYNYRARSPKSFRSRERSRSPESFRSRERSRSPELFRSRERSRSPGYHRSGDKSHDHEHKKDSYKSKELLSKGEPRNSESRNKKKAQNYSSEDSLFSLSLESESASSDSSDDIQRKKVKCTTKTKEKKTDNTKSLKTDTCKIEKNVSEDISVKKADESVFPDNLAELCNFQDKTSEDAGMKEILKFFNSENDNLNSVVKMFESHNFVRKFFEGQVNSQPQPTPPPDAAHNIPELVNSLTQAISPLDATHNTPNLLTPTSFVPNVSFPNVSSSEPYPVMPSVPVPIPFHPPPINSLPPLTFPPPPLVPPPVVPPPVMPPQAIPPPIPATASASVYGPFPVSLPSVDISRIPDTKQVKKRTSTLRPINITADLPSPSKLSKEHSQPSHATSAESKGKKIEKETKASEIFSEENKILIETYKKLKSEKHYAHVKVNSCAADMLEMRKIMDDTWVKKENPSDRAYYSRCKNMLSASQNTMQECLKEARRLDEELNRFKGLCPRHILDQLVNIKIEEPSKHGNTQYSCYDTSNHTCYLCCKPFPNLLSILEHFHSEEHKEQMALHDNDWTKKFNKKPEKTNDNKNKVLKPVQGVEFMKPFTGYFCSLCSEALLDKTSAEQHLKSHDHYWQYKDYNFRNPIYEKKNFFKQFIQRTILFKAKEKRKMQEKEQQHKEAEEAHEKVKAALRDQKNKEKIVEDLDDDDDDDPPSLKSQSSSGIKLNLSSDKDKQSVKEGTKATKAPQRVVYIGKAPNFKARSKPWYKKDIFLNNEESSSQSVESIVPAVAPSKEKQSGNGRKSSPSTKPDSLGDDIPKVVVPTKIEKIAPKKTIESTCLTEEDSKMLGTDSKNASLFDKEKNSIVSNDPTICSTEGESKNLNTNGDDLKKVSVSSADNAQPISSDSGSILNANASSKQSSNVQDRKDTPNQSGSPANENRDSPLAISKDSTVNQALKNILLGTDSSVQEVPLNEIKLPDTQGQNSNNTQTNSLLHGESNVPVPMEIDDTNDESVFNPHPKLTTEEDRDLYILGINREDLIPLAVPVPPPSSLLNCGSPSHSPAALSPKHNRSSANKVSKEANESKVLSASQSSDLNLLLNLKEKSLEYSNSNSKYSKNSSNLLLLTNNTLDSKSLLKSDTGKTSIEFSNLITVETSDVNANDVTTVVSTKSQGVNFESGVDAASDNLMKINETSLEATKAIPLETDDVIEKSSQISDASKGNENLKEKSPSDNENSKKVSDIDLNNTEVAAQSTIVNQITSSTDCVIAKSEQGNSDSNDTEVFSNSIKSHDINKNSDLEHDQNQVTRENNIPAMEVCTSIDKTVPEKNELDVQGLVIGQSLNEDSNNEASGKEVCKAAHMEDQTTNIKPCQSLIIEQESLKESVSESCISPDVLISDEQPNSDIKVQQNSEVVDTEMTLFKKDDHELIARPSSTNLPTEIVSDTKISSSIPESTDINLITSDISSDGNLDSHSSNMEQCVSENVCSSEIVKMEIDSEQPAIVTDKKSQCDVKSDQDSNLQSSNQNLVTENTLDVTEVKSLQEGHTNETEVVEDKTCDSRSADSLHLVSENIKENKSFEMDNKNLQPEPVSISVKSEVSEECEVTPSEVSHLSSNQCDSTSEKTSNVVDTSSPDDNASEGLGPVQVSVTEESISEQETTKQTLDVISESIQSILHVLRQCDSTSEKTSNVVDTSSPDDNASEGLGPVQVSVTGESVSEQETTKQTLDVISESIQTVNKENEDSLPDCNTSIMSQMGLEGNIAGDPESKTQISSSSGEVLETQNLAKSDTDTDEYENEE